MSTNPTYVPQYGNTPAGGALDPTYFGTNSSNPRTSEAEGARAGGSLGWMWQDDDGTRHYNFDYYDDLGSLVKSARRSSSVITSRSTPSRPCGRPRPR